MTGLLFGHKNNVQLRYDLDGSASVTGMPTIISTRQVCVHYKLYFSKDSVLKILLRVALH